ncbi:Peroxidase [Eumeta japonica]|uniref:Peroxidase n=1 Tax=Eumeta variegata TaxID=151549 RepID=A0A4C1W9E8_EUMVA|nr:Peroxidase [Eumeta japonica]
MITKPFNKINNSEHNPMRKSGCPTGRSLAFEPRRGGSLNGRDVGTCRRGVAATAHRSHVATGMYLAPIYTYIFNCLYELRNSNVPNNAIYMAAQKSAASIPNSKRNRDLDCSVNVQPVECCSGGKLGPDATDTERCAPIEIPPHDPDFGPAHVECLDMTRTGTTRDRGCSGPDQVAKPMSAVTAWMDLSLVYGSSDEQAKPLRELKGGRMRTATREGEEWPPQEENVTQSCPAAKSKNEPCYKFGDVRSNQNPQLTVLQIVMLREHNRIAGRLGQINKHWDDEKLYQEARLINIAQYQYICYHEYLPLILGKEYMIEEKMLFPDAERCVDDYDSSVDPAVYDEHANGGAFRNFHSAIIGHLQLLSEERSVTGIARLSDWMNRPLIQEANDTVNFDHLLRGMTTQHEQNVDQYVDMEIFKFLFKGNKDIGIDLHAIDIQRSRDHGIASYCDARKAFGLPVPKTFDDLSKLCGISQRCGFSFSIPTPFSDYYSTNVKKLKTLYKNVKDIELIVGGGLEPIVPDTRSGITFLYIMTRMFKTSRYSDRHFFQNCEDNRFTTEQLQSIQQMSMAKLFCDNSEVEYMQPLAFEGVCDENPLTACHKFEGVDLTLWRDGKAKSSKHSNHKSCY